MTLLPVMGERTRKKLYKEIYPAVFKLKKKNLGYSEGSSSLNQNQHQNLLFNFMIRENIFHFQQLRCHTLQVTFYQKCFSLRLEQRYFKEFVLPLNVKHFPKNLTIWWLKCPNRMRLSLFLEEYWFNIYGVFKHSGSFIIFPKSLLTLWLKNW